MDYSDNFDLDDLDPITPGHEPAYAQPLTNSGAGSRAKGKRSYMESPTSSKSPTPYATPNPSKVRISRGLDLQELAATPHQFPTAASFLSELHSISTDWSRLCPTAEWQWEVPGFIQGLLNNGHSELHLHREVILTKTPPPAPFRSLYGEDGFRCFRAFTWAELFQNQLSSLYPHIQHFLEELVHHVTNHIDDLKDGVTVYEYNGARMHCTWTSVSVTCTEKLELSRPRLLRGMEMLCKILRVEKITEYASISRVRWELIPHAIRDSSNPTEDPSNTETGSKLTLSMSLLDEPLQLKKTEHDCWKGLFTAVGLSTIVELVELYPDGDSEHRYLNCNGKGLELSFKLMIELAAAEYPLVLDGGVIFVGYETVLIPVEMEEGVAQFHLLTNGEENGQINPYRMNLGPRLKIKDYRQFENARCFLGWCEFAQINLGTRTFPTNIDYSGGREKSKSLQLDGFAFVSQFGLSSPLTTNLGIETNTKYISHRLRFTHFGGYCKLLQDTAYELAILYDAAKKRCWMVPKLSLLVYMSQVYASICADSSESSLPFVDAHTDAAELVSKLKDIGNSSIMEGDGDRLCFRQLILGLNTNLLATMAAMLDSSKKVLYGFELMDIVTSPGRGTCMKALDVSSAGKVWMDIVNDADAVVVCSNMDAVITPAASNVGVPQSPRNNPICDTLPEGLDYFATTIPCLFRLIKRRGIQLSTNGWSEPLRVSEKTFWEFSGNPFTPCDHGIKSTDSCWLRMNQIQPLRAESYFGIPMLEKKPSRAANFKIPPSGAVVFGCNPPKKLHRWSRS